MKQITKSLTTEERESLDEMLRNDGFKPLLKAIELLVYNQEQAVLKYNIDGGVDKLVHAKLRAEGARRLFEDIKQVKEKSRQ